jgi:hypothetical protein
MYELTRRSHELQETILRNKVLLKDLSERIAGVLEGKVELPENLTYIFVPRVYRRPVFLPEIYIAAVDQSAIPDRIGLAGPYDPWIVKILNKDRLELMRKVDPTPQPAMDLRAQILRSPELFEALSQAIATVLESHGVTLAADETYAFDAQTVEQPIFAGEISATPITLPAPRGVVAAAVATGAQHAQMAYFPRWFIGIPRPELLAVLEKQRLQVHAGA